MRRLLTLLFILIAGTAFAQKQSFSRATILEPDETVEAVVSLSRAPYVTEFEIDVTDQMFLLELSIEESPADLDLEISLDYLSEHLSQGLEFNERLVLSRTSDPYLATGTATVRVLYQFDVPPVVNGRSLDQIPFRLTARTIDITDETRQLTIGSSLSGMLEPASGMVDLYSVRVPDGMEALRLDISDAAGDLDLFVFPGALSADPFQATYVAQSIRSSESLVIDAGSAPSLAPGTYYVMVLDQISTDGPVSYELHATAGRDAPAALLEVSALPAVQTPLARALLATVEVLTPDGGGSGCIVSSDGYIITNWHVVEGYDGKPSRDITIGFSTDHTLPPEEAFRAEVVDFAPEQDLALLRITSGLYGQPLPQAFRFPFHEISDQLPDIAAALRFVGYPWIGGTGSRASLTYTEGTVAGYQQTSFGTLLKSDGEINPGNSGGAALDSRYRLVGFPSWIVGENAGQLAYVVPISAIPSAWRQEFGQ